MQPTLLQPIALWKLVVGALAAASFVFVISVVFDKVLLVHEHITGRYVIEVSDLITASLAGAAFFIYGQMRRRAVLRRLNIIAEMNHHIRNSLQVIAASRYIGDGDEAVAAIDDAVKRVEWALREVLPRV